MDFMDAVKEASAVGVGTIIRDEAGRKWEVTETGLRKVVPISHTGHHAEINWTTGNDWSVDPVEEPKPEPTPEPELLTGYEAVVKAGQDGGEIWGNDGCFRIALTKQGAVMRKSKTHEINMEAKRYTVRPLPSATLSWPEALEQMLCDKKVKVVGDDTSFGIIFPFLATEERVGGVMQVRSLFDLKDKQFTAV